MHQSHWTRLAFTLNVLREVVRLESIVVKRYVGKKRILGQNAMLTMNANPTTVVIVDANEAPPPAKMNKGLFYNFQFLLSLSFLETSFRTLQL